MPFLYRKCVSQTNFNTPIHVQIFLSSHHTLLKIFLMRISDVSDGSNKVQVEVVDILRGETPNYKMVAMDDF